MKKARHNFDDHSSTALEGRVSSDKKKWLALGKEGTFGRTENNVRADSGNFRARKLSQHRRSSAGWQ
jgi:hypothetical protein